MLIYLIFIFTIYFGFLLVVIVGWTKFTNQDKSLVLMGNEFASVVVAVRDEEQAIAPLLESISLQDFPNTGFEVIFVDDHSMDQTGQKIYDWIKDNPTIHCNYYRSSGVGKKQALNTGIEYAKGNIILTTDADCKLPTNWISGMVRSFPRETSMVIGLVKIQQGSSWFSRLQALEFNSLLGSGIALSVLGYPVMCNGASLAFRKSSFDAVSGYEGNLHIPSGDDEFLMRKINRRFPGSIESIHFPSVMVATQPQPSVYAFINQRLRWAGKWKANNSIAAKGLALFVLVLQLTVIGAASFLVGGDYKLEVGILLSVKIFMEGYFLFKVSKGTYQRFSTPAFLVLQIIYPFYVTIIGILSQFLDFEWKGRRKHSAG